MTWLFIGTDLHFVCIMCDGCLTSYLIMETREVVPWWWCGVAFFRASLVPFPIPLSIAAGCSGGSSLAAPRLVSAPRGFRDGE